MNTQYIKKLPNSMLPAAKIFSALGDTTRQKIVLLFQKDEEISIKTIVELFPFSRTTIVHHLEVLERAGVISSRRDGKASLYKVNPDIVMGALRDLSTYISEEFYAETPSNK